MVLEYNIGAIGGGQIGPAQDPDSSYDPATPPESPMGTAIASVGELTVSQAAYSDRIKSEYSNQYALIIDRSSFYNASPFDESGPGGTGVGSIVIQQSAAPGSFDSLSDERAEEISYETPPTTTDAFRQCLGRVWSFKNPANSNEQSPTVTFLYDEREVSSVSSEDMIPRPYRHQCLEGGAKIQLTFEDVSVEWNNIFEKGVYGDSLNLPRKASRLKIATGTDNLLNNRMFYLSLLTDIKAKNSTEPYKDLNTTLNFVSNAGNPPLIDLNSPSPGSAGQYNFKAALSKNELPMRTDGGPSSMTYKKAKESDMPESELNEILNYWEGELLNLLNSTIDLARMDSFYDFINNDYAYDRVFYNDTSFKMQTPMSPRAIELASETNKSILYVDIQPIYNYYSKNYENAVNSKTALNERKIPSIYDVPIEEDNNTPAPLTERPLSQFNFEQYGRWVLKGKTFPDRSEGDEIFYDHIILDQTSNEFVQKYDSIKNQFPFYTNIEFNTPSNRTLTSIFNKSGMTDLLIKAWISNVFTANSTGGTPSKNAPIGPDGNRYYNSLDINPDYRNLPRGNAPSSEAIPPICSSGIYSLSDKKALYNLVPPDESSDATISSGIIGPQGSEVYRQFDVNKFLDGYIKYLYNADGPWTTVAQDSEDRIYTWDYEEFVNKLFLNNSGETLYSDPKDGKYKRNGVNSPEATLGAFVFIADYQNIIGELTRNYEQILNKELSYNETMFYRVQKTPLQQNGAPSNPDANPVQNFWIPVPNNTDGATGVLKYVDTQVKYGQRYEYTVYAYQIVVGSKYGFQFVNSYYSATSDTSAMTGIQANYFGSKFVNYRQSVKDSASNSGFVGTNTTSGNNSAEFLTRGESLEEGANILFMKPEGSHRRMGIFDVICEPDVRLVEVPVYKKEVCVSDAPPAPPEIDIVPLNGKKNEIKINFFPGSVGNEMIPIIIDYENDIPRFDAIRKAQGRELKKLNAPPETTSQLDYVDPMIMFKSDDFPIQYEVYRIEKKPINYDSFRNDGAISKSTKTVIDAEEASAYIDKIEQNKKYYYMFRAIDVHNNPSNPSPIYEVEMVENSGVVYPVISIYEPDPEMLGIKSKSFKRYLKIEPDSMQGILNLDESMQVNEQGVQAQSALNLKKAPTLGIKEQSVFSDINSTNPIKFKFRIKSKHTGKILDLNVAFKSRAIEGDQEIVSYDGTGRKSSNEAEVKSP
tara:strand:- start:2170 stop:5793 length:3624 start_codon:yes stop_codon:yes gene_type:complete